MTEHFQHRVAFQKFMYGAEEEKETHPHYRDHGGFGPVAEEDVREKINADGKQYISQAEYSCIAQTHKTKVFQVAVQYKKYRQQHQVKRVGPEKCSYLIHFLIMRYSMRSVPGIFT